MKKTISAMIVFALLGFLNSAVHAAELLDVKPVVVGSAVSIEISADIAMTYTFYKVPGQARAVVDIAEADPEKVEPLIVVNKGAVSSISVDKAQISGIIVSRIIFNLTSESDISVSANPDRKLLTVTFVDSTAAGKPEATPEPSPKPVQPPEPIAKAVPPLVVEAAPPTGALLAEEPPKPGESPANDSISLPKTAVEVSSAALPAVPTIIRSTKLEPVVPISITPFRPHALSVKEIVTGSSYIEIRTNQPVTDYKTTRISGPDRLIIDIASEKINQKQKSVVINKFGISKARIGISPKNIRIVIDSAKTGFPAYTISIIDEGLRVNFL